jgi:hypothetical protein
MEKRAMHIGTLPALQDLFGSKMLQLTGFEGTVIVSRLPDVIKRPQAERA